MPVSVGRITFELYKEFIFKVPTGLQSIPHIFSYYESKILVLITSFNSILLPIAILFCLIRTIYITQYYFLVAQFGLDIKNH